MTSIISLLKTFLLINVCSGFIYPIPSYSLSKYNKPIIKTILLNHNNSSSYFIDNFIVSYKSNFFTDTTVISLYIYLLTYYCKLNHPYIYMHIYYIVLHYI